jgi:hypothetical protein
MFKTALTSLMLLIAAANCTQPARGESRPREAYQQLAAAYVEADAAGKQRWVEKLIERSNTAIRVYMPPTELARQQARNQQILDRATKGRELSAEGLLRLLGEVDRQEQAAIKHLSRDYAFLTAQNFHNNRAEFDKWTEAWEKLEYAWQLQGRPMNSQPELIGWLQQAPSRLALARATAPREAPSVVRTVPRRTGPPFRRSELEARIVGYNLALSRLMSQLQEQKNWTGVELARVAGELADLTTARHDLLLYWNLLPEQERRQMPALGSLDGVMSLLSSRTAQRRRQLEAGELPDAPRTAWELRRLDEVSRRLATLASDRS